MCQNHKLPLTVTRRESSLKVTITVRAQTLVFYSLATPLHLLMPLQCASPTPLPTPPFFSSFPVSFLFYYTHLPPPQPLPPPSPPPTSHPRLPLNMNNAGRGGLLDRRLQHATACFIHTKLRHAAHSSPLAHSPITLRRPSASKSSALA